ncbi:MAG: spore coat associated protein CotJA [Oscillospiraceae bacterium]|nr:spore coat associated protein CotJA [Oscillospiraceae bacterium]
MSSLPMPTTAFPAATPIGMAYVPYQQWQEPYDADMALDRGTMFPELDLPFMGGECSE